MYLTRFFCLLLIGALCCIGGAWADVVNDRIIDYVNLNLTNPRYDPENPNFDPDDPELVDQMCWARTGYALASLFLDTNQTTANLYLNWVIDFETIPSTGEDSFAIYFMLPAIWRAYLLDQQLGNGFLDSDTKDNIEDLMWTFVQYRSTIAAANSRVWDLKNTDNHDALQKSSHLLAMQVLKDAGAPYSGSTQLADGSTIDQHLAAWERYFFEYFRQRAREGLSCEIASLGYNRVSMEAWMNIYDFTRSNDLAAIAEDYITLFFADYAGDFLPMTGLRGAAGNRWYLTGLTLPTDSLREVLFAHNWHDNWPTYKYPEDLVLLTSFYRIPEIVSRAASTHDRTPYLAKTRRFGKGPMYDANLIHHVQFDADNASDLLRETYWHKDYVMGGLTLRTDGDIYNHLIDQNREMGIFFASDPKDRILFDGKGIREDGKKGYTEITGYCGTKCLVAGWDKNAEPNDSDGVQIYITTGTLMSNLATDSGWLFTKTGPYGAGRWLVADENDDDPTRNNELLMGAAIPGGGWLTPAITTGGGGQSGEALDFNPAAYQCARAMAGWTGQDSVKVDFWFRPDVNNVNQTLIAASGVWEVRLESANVKFYLTTTNGTSSATRTGAATTGSWHHCVATVDTAGAISLVVDDTTATGGNSYPMASLNVNIDLANKSGLRYYDGRIDTVSISIPSYNYEPIAVWNMESAYTRDVYTGIRIANGSYDTPAATPDNKGWMLHLTDKFSPVVFEAADASDYADFDAFKTDCKNNSFSYDTGTYKLTYTSCAGDTYEYWGNSGTLPKINGATVNLNPTKTYDSPYLQGEHGMDTVKISYPGFSDLVLDFNYSAVPLWDDYQTLGLWHMDSLTGGKVSDDDLEDPGQNRNNDLTRYNGAALTTGSGGKFGEAMVFDGTNDYVQAATNWASHSTLKVDFWYNRDNNANLQTLVNAVSAWEVRYNNGIQLISWDSNGGTPTATLTGNCLTTGVWHHLTGTIEANGLITLQIDDQITTASSGYGLKLQNKAIIAGAKQNGTRHFDGRIDDLKIRTYAVK